MADDKPSVLTQQGTAIHTLARPGEDYVAGLEALAAALSLHAAPPATQPREKAEPPSP